MCLLRHLWAPFVALSGTAFSLCCVSGLPFCGTKGNKHTDHTLIFADLCSLRTEQTCLFIFKLLSDLSRLRKNSAATSHQQGILWQAVTPFQESVGWLAERSPAGGEGGIGAVALHLASTGDRDSLISLMLSFLN